MQTRCRKWRVTHPNYSEEYIKFYSKLRCRYIIHGIEATHLKLFIVFVNQTSLGAVIKTLPPGAHIEPARDSIDENVARCRTWSEVVERGNMPQSRERYADSHNEESELRAEEPELHAEPQVNLVEQVYQNAEPQANLVDQLYQNAMEMDGLRTDAERIRNSIRSAQKKLDERKELLVCNKKRRAELRERIALACADESDDE